MEGSIVIELNGILRQEKNGVWLARVYVHAFTVHVEGRSEEPGKAKFYTARAVNRLVGGGTRRSRVEFHLIGESNV